MYSEKGQSLMELVIVIAVVVIVIGALVFATIASLRNAQFAKNQAQASKLAQEGLEWVRTGRDRNKGINDLDSSVTNWDTIWGYQISGGPDTFCNSSSIIKQCYFKILSDGSLIYINSSSAFPSGFAESIQPNFERAITLSDDSASSDKQKTVTAIVTWTDFSGPHESKLTTILRKL